MGKPTGATPGGAPTAKRSVARESPRQKPATGTRHSAVGGASSRKPPPVTVETCTERHPLCVRGVRVAGLPIAFDAEVVPNPAVDSAVQTAVLSRLLLKDSTERIEIELAAGV